MNAKIISVSRRTDIPAFYGEWFMNGIKRGYVDSINPFNSKYISRISLKKDDVSCFVFWSKNPLPFIPYLNVLDILGYKYYFQYTLTPYENDIEENVPDIPERVATFKKLSQLIGKDKVIWRYDPILVNERYTIDYHKNMFTYLSNELRDYTQMVIISFIDMYLKTKRNMGIVELDIVTMNIMAEIIAEIALRNGLRIATCSEENDFRKYGISRSNCIDGALVIKITGINNAYRKDKGQRKWCGCVSSIDIGSNNTCLHNCTYCYANVSLDVVKKKVIKHNPNSSLLCGELSHDQTIHWRNGENLGK